MVEEPRLHLRIAPATSFQAAEPQSERIERVARLWAAARGLTELPRCRVEPISMPRAHTGLGTGTQLALSVAAGLDAFCRLPSLPVEQLGPALGRGQRSAVGLHGFFSGGLIAELGRLAHEPISPLHRRIELPAAWRFVLLCPRGNTGLHGRDEADIFGCLPPVPPQVTDELSRELKDCLLPAVQAGDLAAFGESVYRFGRQAGLCYAAVQGGPYGGPRVEMFVERIRSFGVAGVGQSSGDPPSMPSAVTMTEAKWLIDQLKGDRLLDECDVTVSAPHNCGATVIERRLREVRFVHFMPPACPVDRYVPCYSS